MKTLMTAFCALKCPQLRQDVRGDLEPHRAVDIPGSYFWHLSPDSIPCMEKYPLRVGTTTRPPKRGVVKAEQAFFAELRLIVKR